MNNLQQKLFNKYKENTDSQLLQLLQGLTRLDSNPNNPEIINSIFRNAHTIKGDANMMAFREVGMIAHEMENIFDEMRSGNLDYGTNSDAISEVLFEAADALQTMVDAMARGEQADINVKLLVTRLQKIANTSAAAEPVVEVAPPPPVPAKPAATKAAPVPVTPAPQPKLDEKQAIRYKETAEGLLLALQQGLIKLELNPKNPELLKELFRAAHTLKGDARMLGLRDIGTVAHEMENVLDALRNDQLDYAANSDAISEVLFEAIDAIQTLVNNVNAAQPVAVDFNSTITKLQAVTNPEGIEEELPEPEVITPAPATPAVAQTPTANNAPAQTSGQVAMPNAANLFDNVIKVPVERLDSLMNISGELMLDKMQAESTLRNLRSLQDLLRQRQRISQPVRNLLAAEGRDPTEITTLVDIRQSLLQINQIDQQIENLIRTTFKEYEEHSSHLQTTIDEMESNVLEMRMLPLQTIYDDLPRMVRELTRQSSDSKAKIIVKANIELGGGEIELDKKVLEEIVAPLGHIIRNCFAHGFQPQPASARKEVGKPETGLIRVLATSESGFVIIKVADDGAGVDPEIIRQKAVEKGLMSRAKADATPDDEIINVIFESRFSTRQIIDELAGRGVGMDVVKNNIERLNGHVSVSSQKGLGTTITLKVPLTYAISRALMVRVDNDLFAIPAPAVQAMRYLNSDEIMVREGRDVILHDTAVVPLMRLMEVLGVNKNASHPLFRYLRNEAKIAMTASTPVKIGAGVAENGANGNGNGTLHSPFTGLVLADPQAQAMIQAMKVANENRTLRQLSFERLPAVVVGTGDRRICFIVDELVDETEIVLKSLNPVLGSAEYVSGATIMGDGRVVLILDIPSLINAAKNGSKTIGRQNRVSQAPRRRILVVDDSITTRELEKSILEAQGYEVDLADDGTVALDRLRQNNRYDLVISDVEMPRMDGFELAARIKADPNLRALPVIIVSSLNSEANKRRGIESGAQAYITKGDFNQNNLLDTIEYLTS